MGSMAAVNLMIAPDFSQLFLSFVASRGTGAVASPMRTERNMRPAAPPPLHVGWLDLQPECFYNTIRRHSALGNLSPLDVTQSFVSDLKRNHI
jgi:hypothetical protein